ncbi:hypothetical protein [Trichloromonas sp.]|uniref:hypothetical protein n=1 Tax=Trichloromonas sp. TaxID=3069249 RepID=UPI002A3E3423|nr:hypothetical protein [Trichloromonas sp.]
MSFFKPLKNQRGALVLIVLVIFAVGAPVLYTTGRYMEHRREDIVNVENKIISGEEISEEEFERAHSAIPDVANLAQASGAVLNSVSNIGVPDPGTAISVAADVAIGEMVSRNTSPPPTTSNPIPADIPAQTPVCDGTHLSNCTSRTTCDSAGGYWHSNNTCRPDPEQRCNEDDLSGCVTQASCSGAGGHWYDDQCNQSPEACYSGSPELCANENDCTNANAYWYNSQCNSDALAVSITSPAGGSQVAENQVTVTGSYQLYAQGITVSSAGFVVNGVFQPATISGQTFSSIAVLATGQNQISARVTTSAGDTYNSAPITITSNAVQNRYHVRITWDKDDTDVDLHFTWNGSDCYYGNKTPTWGSAETSPRLDVDDTNGFGPENITIESLPGPGTYKIWVRYYSDHGKGGTNVNAAVYENGVSIFSSSNYMEHHNEWTLWEFIL